MKNFRDFLLSLLVWVVIIFLAAQGHNLWEHLDPKGHHAFQDINFPGMFAGVIALMGARQLFKSKSAWGPFVLCLGLWLFYEGLTTKYVPPDPNEVEQQSDESDD
jgi:hypothetical protein